VVAAQSETSELERRYQQAINDAATRGVDSTVKDFGSATSSSRAVIARWPTEVSRLLNSDRELYATYYDLAAVRHPQGDEWDMLRTAADAIFFPSYQESIRFANLTLSDSGIANYGSCFLFPREDMIAHRASLFVENTAVYFRDAKGLRSAKDIPTGLRATWEKREKLCVIKLSAYIDGNTTVADFTGLLSQDRAQRGDDDKFIEVHIYGPITMRSLEEIGIARRRLKKYERALVSGFSERAKKYGVKVL